MIVIQKYGGSVIKDVSDIIKIGNKIISEFEKNNKYIIVLSSFKNKTNNLFKNLQELNVNLNSSASSKYLSSGEIESCFLLNEYLKNKLNSTLINILDIELRCTNNYINADILSINQNKLRAFLKKYDILIIPGFTGINDLNEIVTLKRNGSDTTAIFLLKECSLIDKSKCTLFKDTSIYQIDPKIKVSQHHNQLDYEQVKLLNNNNCSIISKEANIILKDNNLEVIIENFNNNEKTIISNKPSNLDLIYINIIKTNEIIIKNIKNNKLINYVKHLFKNDYIEYSKDITILSDKKINKYLDILILIDPNIELSIKPINYYKYIYNDRIIYSKSDLNVFKE